ncbi:CpsD/CapB family tyrosine-protein kinase [Paenibacillus oenotherae]|uniref:non-specific protein-tyrosine kinase n=1 Tax=Paenibacillus oenotherae TaxID=1435645 RepID=A0ABS7DA28_9BACL|nr:CpsD/CapB family tyrosine-protein kinase [Paenibacillus oenotherae]MBW7476715.1 CpsD/CapB family tyrosine-protein kinase [Paenibacillus oenotherae]
MSRSTHRNQLITMISPTSPASEAYKILRTNIEISNIEQDLQTIMVTSTKKSEGKSSVAANLAVAYAQSNKKVLLIDADMRNPAQHHIFNLSNRIGLSSLLNQKFEWSDAAIASPVENLTIITAGSAPHNPSEMLASKFMIHMLEELKERFEVIIIDTPPFLSVADAQIVASKCDGVILVIDSGEVNKDVAQKAKENLEFVKAKLIGVVLNNVNRRDASGYY